MKGGADFNTAEHNTMESGRVAEVDTKGIEFVCARLCSLCLAEPASHGPLLCRHLAAHKENKVDGDVLDAGEDSDEDSDEDGDAGEENLDDDEDSDADEGDLDDEDDLDTDLDADKDSEDDDDESDSSFLSDEEVEDAFALMDLSHAERQEVRQKLLLGVAPDSIPNLADAIVQLNSERDSEDAELAEEEELEVEKEIGRAHV